MDIKEITKSWHDILNDILNDDGSTHQKTGKIPNYNDTIRLGCENRNGYHSISKMPTRLTTATKNNVKFITNLDFDSSFALSIGGETTVTAQLLLTAKIMEWVKIVGKNNIIITNTKTKELLESHNLYNTLEFIMPDEVNESYDNFFITFVGVGRIITMFIIDENGLLS